MKKTLAKISSGLLVVFASVTGAFAQKVQIDTSIIDGIGGKDANLVDFITGLINTAIGLAALASVVMLIAAGYMYITAGGDEGKVGKATKMITFAIIGLVVCFIAVMLVTFVLDSILKVK